MVTCQSCGNEMKKGYLQSIRRIFWSEEKREGIVLPYKDDIKLSKPFYPSYLEAYICTDCKAIVVRYK